MRTVATAAHSYCIMSSQYGSSIAKRLRAARTTAFAFLLLALPAQGSVLGIYDNRTTWEGLTSGRVDIDFSSLGLAPGGWANYGTADGLTISGVTLRGIHGGGGYQLLASYPTAGSDYDYESGTLLRGPEYHAAGSYLLIMLPVGVTSFGIDLMTVDPAARTFRIELDGVDIGFILAAQVRPNRTFFGVQTDTPISQVRIILNSGTTWLTRGQFDNLAYGAVYVPSSGGGGGGEPSGHPPVGGEVPEVTTVLYVGTGLALVLFTRRRRGWSEQA